MLSTRWTIGKSAVLFQSLNHSLFHLTIAAQLWRRIWALVGVAEQSPWPLSRSGEEEVISHYWQTTLSWPGSTCSGAAGSRCRWWRSRSPSSPSHSASRGPPPPPRRYVGSCRITTSYLIIYLPGRHHRCSLRQKSEADVCKEEFVLPVNISTYLQSVQI